MKGQPIRFDYKLWILSSGYPFHIGGYTEKIDQENVKEPVGMRTLLKALKSAEVPTDDSLFMGNFITSLLQEPKVQGFLAAETVRDRTD